MTLPFSLFLALKYLKPRRTFLSVVTVISVLGVILGVAVLVIVLSVMSGFDEMWREKILSFNAHVTVGGDRVLEDEERWMEIVECVPGVSAVAPYVQGLVFVQFNDRVLTPILRGIDPERERGVSRIPEHIIAGSFDVSDENVVLGRDLAERLGVQLGDRILVYSPQTFVEREELTLPEELTVAGIYELGMWEFDVGFVLASLPVARELYGLEYGVHALQIMTADPFRADRVAERIARAIDWAVPVVTWMEQNRQLFSALRVEKNMMFFLLIFITVVAAFGITNTLITVTVQKTHEIGLLKALGFSSRSIMGVFLWQGWVDGFLGTIGGIGLGLVALYYRNDLMNALNRRFGLDLLPKELYHLSEIPAVISWSDIGLIAAAVMVICTLAGVIPAWRAARLDPVQALRYE